MLYYDISPHRETSQQPPAAPSTNSSSKVPAPTQPEPHLLFIPVTHADLAHGKPPHSAQ